MKELHFFVFPYLNPMSFAVHCPRHLFFGFVKPKNSLDKIWTRTPPCPDFFAKENCIIRIFCQNVKEKGHFRAFQKKTKGACLCFFFGFVKPKFKVMDNWTNPLSSFFFAKKNCIICSLMILVL